MAGSVSDADILRETSAAHEADPKIPVRSVAEESDLTADRLSWTQGATMGVEGLGGCFLIVSFAGTPADKKNTNEKQFRFLENPYFCGIKTMPMEQTSNLYGLSQPLFWDIDTRNFDIDRNAAWIIQRVLEYGTMKDWMIIEDHFGVDKIVSYAQTLRTLDPVALSFLCFISGTKKEDYRCYHFAKMFPTLWNT